MLISNITDIVAMRTQTMVTIRHVEKTVQCWQHPQTITHQWKNQMSLVPQCHHCIPV